MKNTKNNHLIPGILFAAFFVIFPTTQSFPQTWVKILLPNKQTNPLAIEETYDKGYAVGGYFWGPAGTVKDGLLIKTDINGNTLWYKTIGENDGAILDDVTNDLDGGLILSGGTHSLEAWDDPLIMKLNPCMEVEWCRIYHTPNPNYGDWGQSIYPLAGGGYIVSVIQFGMDENKIIWLFKLDNNGELVWQKYYTPIDPLASNELSWSMNISSDSSFLLSGDCYYPQQGTTLNWIHPLLIKTDINGELDWELIWGADSVNVIGTSINRSVTDISGDIYSCGYRHRPIPPYGYTPSIYKTSRVGEEIFHKDVIPTSSNGGFVTINWLIDSSLVLYGEWIDSSGSVFNSVFNINRCGDTLKTKLLDNTMDFTVRDAVITFDNKIILTADKWANNMTRTYLYKLNSDMEYDSIYTAPFVYDSLCPHPIPTDTIPLDCVIVGMDEPQKLAEENKLLVYPNPASDKITIVIPDKLVTESKTTLFSVTTVFHQWDKATVEIFDVNGRKIYQEEIPSAQKQVEVDVSGWQRGMYLVRLAKNGLTISSVNLIIN